MIRNAQRGGMCVIHPSVVPMKRGRTIRGGVGWAFGVASFAMGGTSEGDVIEV